MIKIIGISGSLRKDSFNTRLLNIAASLLPETAAFATADIGELPHYNQDLDVPAMQSRPVSVDRFRGILSEADGLLIASPEYNYSIPGVLKNAIDWASRGQDSPLLNKPVALIGATPGGMGTVRMQLAFLPIFQFLNMRVIYKPEVLIAQANLKFDSNGNLMDAVAVTLLKQKMDALVFAATQTN